MTAGTLSPDSEPRLDGVKSGLVLAFTLVVLVLMAIMGVVILSNTRTELNITANNRLGREAFNSADATASMATFLAVTAIRVSTEPIDDSITSGASMSPSPRYPLYICFPNKDNSSDNTAPGDLDRKLTRGNLVDESKNRPANFNYSLRYRNTGASSEKPKPHIIFKLGPCNNSSSRELANAVVNIEREGLFGVGTSLDTLDMYDNNDGIPVSVIVSVNAKTNESLSLGVNEPNSIVTVMYRTVL
ncbi:MAG: hypothetical protein LBR80_16195 [Deltaproteobacteria bacterium]|nr:hypothetical protein [Deltaproteobacteria bacterium]